MDRVSTGNPAADQILHGGFPARSINIVMGPPGSGKTTFVQQLAFHNAGARPVLYLTTVSEPMGKLLTYLQESTFADPRQIGVKVIYESLAEVLSAEPEKLVEAITGLILQHRPQLIVIDSFKAIGDLMPDRSSWRRALFNLAGLLTAYDTTSFWVGEYTPEMVSELPEFATADGILDFSREQRGSRDDRYLRVVKLRGSDFLDGFHSFRITRAGLEVSVRLVTPASPTHHRAGQERLTSGIAGLDQMIETGWLRGTTTLVEGPSGAGKTALGLHFLREGVARGEASLLVSFQESPSQLARVFHGFGWESQQLIAPGKLDLLYTSPVELQMDSIVTEMFKRIEVHGVRRVVIDTIGDMEKSARDPLRFRDYLYALGQHFAVRDITTLFMLERGRDDRSGIPVEISPMTDNTLLLGMNLEGELTRTIQLIKSRGSAHDGRRRSFRITSQGLAVEAVAGGRPG